MTREVTVTTGVGKRIENYDAFLIWVKNRWNKDLKENLQETKKASCFAIELYFQSNSYCKAFEEYIFTILLAFYFLLKEKREKDSKSNSVFFIYFLKDFQLFILPSFLLNFLSSVNSFTPSLFLLMIQMEIILCVFLLFYIKYLNFSLLPTAAYMWRVSPPGEKWHAHICTF